MKLELQLIVSFCICSVLVTFTLCAQFFKHNLHMISSVCFLTRLTIRICIMCRYLFSPRTLTQIWPIFGPCLLLPFQFRLISLFEQFRFHNAFAFLHQAEERYQVRRANKIVQGGPATVIHSITGASCIIIIIIITTKTSGQ